MERVRLGRNERHFLLRLASGQILWTFPDDAPAKVACSRALGKLVRLNLIKTAVCPEHNTPSSPFARSVTRINRYGQVEHYLMYRQVHALQLTAKGRRIVDTFRSELETGGRIRWAQLPPSD